MEYSIYITYKCNLRCPYCYVKDRFSSQTEKLTDEKLDQIKNYILKNNQGQKDFLIFYGGEPLMEYEIIRKLINRTKKLNLSYGVYTNGLLLDKVPLNTLRLLDIILVSIDGDKKTHEEYRGRGTYEKIINNLKTIKSKLNSLIIGRITVTEETNIYKSVKNLLSYVDTIHWQIVNKPDFKNVDKFINNYKRDTKKLFNFWLSNLKRGNLLNIIPFQAIASSFIFGYPQNNLSFRCGAGTDLQVIDIDGNIYWCDEYVGNQKALIGNINNNQVTLPYKEHTEIFKDCKECEFSTICRGRCRRVMEEYSTNQVKNYCELTKYLIKTISKKTNEIKNILKSKKYNFEKFYDRPKWTEEIP